MDQDTFMAPGSFFWWHNMRPHCHLGFAEWKPSKLSMTYFILHMVLNPVQLWLIGQVTSFEPDAVDGSGGRRRSLLTPGVA